MMIPADSPPPSCFGPAAGDAPAGRDRGGRVRRPPSAHDGSTERGQDDAGPGVGSPDEAGRGHPPHGADGRTDRQAPWTFWSDFRSACPTVLGTKLGSATQPQPCHYGRVKRPHRDAIWRDRSNFISPRPGHGLLERTGAIRKEVGLIAVSHSIASLQELIVHTTGPGDANRLYIYTASPGRLIRPQDTAEVGR